MSVEIMHNGEVLTAFLSGEIDHHTAAPIRDRIDNALDMSMPSMLVLDFSGVTFMDSSGIGLVMGRYGKLSKRGGEIHISNAAGNVYKMLKIGGIERLATLDAPKEIKER